MGGTDLRDFGRKKWMLSISLTQGEGEVKRKKEERKKENGRKKHSKGRNLILFESVE